MLDANFWQNKSLAQKVIKEKKLHENLINSYEDSIKKLSELNVPEIFFLLKFFEPKFYLSKN